MDIRWIQLNILQNHKPSIYQHMQEICLRSLDLNFKAKLKLESGTQKIQYGHQAAFLEMTYLKINRLLPYTLVMCYWSLDLIFKAKQKLESGNPKIQYGRQAAILEVTLLKINGLLTMDTNDVAVKFGLDIQSQTKVRVPKPKNPRWPPGNHFEGDIAENQSASAHGHQQHAYGISNWNSEANLSYAPETMSPTDHPPPLNFVGLGYKNV